MICDAGTFQNETMSTEMFCTIAPPARTPRRRAAYCAPCPKGVCAKSVIDCDAVLGDGQTFEYYDGLPKGLPESGGGIETTHVCRAAADPCDRVRPPPLRRPAPSTPLLALPPAVVAALVHGAAYEVRVAAAEPRRADGGGGITEFIVDATPPLSAPIVVATAEARGGDAAAKIAVALGASWAGFADDGGSGIAGYAVCFGTDGAPDALGCADVGLKTEAVLWAEAPADVPAGTTYRATVTATDRAGHATSVTSVGARASAAPAPVAVQDSTVEYSSSCSVAAGSWAASGGGGACAPHDAWAMCNATAAAASRRPPQRSIERATRSVGASEALALIPGERYYSTVAATSRGGVTARSRSETGVVCDETPPVVLGAPTPHAPMARRRSRCRRRWRCAGRACSPMRERPGVL